MSMRDYISIGSAPAEEACVQVVTGGDYRGAMSRECSRFLKLIRQKIGSEPEGARLAVKRFSHEYGEYMEVVCYYDDAYPESVKYAYRCERETPTRWNELEPTKDSLHPEGI